MIEKARVGVRRVVTVFSATVVGVLGLGVAAYAAPSPDPDVVAAVEDGFGTTKTLFTDNLIPMFFTLALVVLAFLIGWRLLRRAARA